MESLGIPKESLGIPNKSFGIPRDDPSLMGTACRHSHSFSGWHSHLELRDLWSIGFFSNMPSNSGSI